ncbi:MAG: hypothetical protein ACI4JJ_04445 [Huintestinicola sp.]
MASRIMHMAAASVIAERLGIADKNRFIIGQLLPDAVILQDKAAVGSHFPVMVGTGKKVMDFSRFRERFAEDILSDSLYLGYYFHLIQDCVFRRIIYYDKGFLEMRGKEGFLDRLYADYRSINGYVINKYGIENVPTVPCGFSSERINEIYPFDLELFLEDMAKDFSDVYSADNVYFAAEDADRFISDSARVCAEEYCHLQEGGGYADPIDHAWELGNAE